MLITEKFPSNPDEVILKNEYYPDGLTHRMVYDYYMSNKRKILSEVKDRKLIFFFATKFNTIIVKRMHYDQTYYNLNDSNYEEVLSGRTVSIHSTMGHHEDLGIVDIDGEDWEKNKTATAAVYQALQNSAVIKSLKIIYTGKSSFHIRVTFHKENDPFENKKILEKIIKEANLPYEISYKRNSKEPIIDLSSNKYRGGFITLHSLSVLGLKSMEVKLKDLATFDKHQAKITSKTYSHINEAVRLVLESVDPEQRMQHCYSELEVFLKKVGNNPIYWSTKIDGVRCWIVVNKRYIGDRVGGLTKQFDISYISRNNKSFDNLHVFDQDIIKLCDSINSDLNIKYPIILDCEVSGPGHNLSSLMMQLRRKTDVQHSHFTLNIFDIAIEKDYITRQKILSHAFASNKNKQIVFLEGQPIKGEANILKMKEKVIKAGHEGIVLTDGTSTYHFGQRTRLCCKLKKFNTIELKVVGIIPGQVGTKFEGMVAALICDYNGKRLHISGQMSHEFRKELLKEPPIGKWIEVRYSEITSDGKLRDPVFLRFRPDLE